MNSYIKDKAGSATIGAWYIGTTNLNATSEKIKMGSGTGNIVCVKLTETSRREAKKNIKSFEKNATDIINSASIRNYQYLEDKDIDVPYVGLVLDEAPIEVIDTTGEGVIPSNATFVAWKAIQELSSELEEEKAKNAMLTDELSELRSEIDYIKAMLNM